MCAASHNRRVGVILAAGRGGRMGGRKQLTEWLSPEGAKPLVAAAYDAIRPICDEMVVVLGHLAEAVAAALGDRPFHRAESDPDAPMYESIRAGLCVAMGLDADGCVVLQPGDHPEVGRTTLETVASWSLKRPGRAIIPQFDGLGGHPVLIPANICAVLLDAVCPEGLGQFWLDHPELCVRISIDDPAIIRDIDTPADLA